MSRWSSWVCAVEIAIPRRRLEIVPRRLRLYVCRLTGRLRLNLPVRLQRGPHEARLRSATIVRPAERTTLILCHLPRTAEALRVEVVRAAATCKLADGATGGIVPERLVADGTLTLGNTGGRLLQLLSDLDLPRRTAPRLRHQGFRFNVNPVLTHLY